MSRSPVEATLDNLRARLLAARVGDHWEGRLSSSALASATASIALSLGGRDELAKRGVAWLMDAQNDDGGWGDTALSLSNISTTALGWAALTVGPAIDAQKHVDLAAAYMERHAGGLDPDSLTQAIKRRYGKDHTFSVPILTVLAIAGLLGEHGWSRVPQLPFELAYFPQRWYSLLQLPVVSYALPALIGIGQARHAKNPSTNPLARIFRDWARQSTLQKLLKIQPSNGGFLEATPLTSFVTMSLIVAGQGDHPVARKGLDFLQRSVRTNGSWPIDTNLSTWLTTLGISALSAGPGLTLGSQQRAATSAWLLSQQFRQEHPYTAAAPGGWAWTDLPGGVPDADDTAGALLAVRALADPTPDTVEAVRSGVLWLVDLQNRDGGIPTFCRGWGALPFDRSSPDLTAHALRAWQAWRLMLPPAEAQRVGDATNRAIRYLESVQHADGSWAPLWFGNPHAPNDVNLTYGTARVLLALADSAADVAPLAEQAAELWLLNAQGTDGGWGGAPGVLSSIEETAVAVSALAFRRRRRNLAASVDAIRSITRGVDWLVSATEQGLRTEPSPIGFYFAKLWYFEELYPLIFSLEALGHVATLDLQNPSCPGGR